MAIRYQKYWFIYLSVLNFRFLNFGYFDSYYFPFLSKLADQNYWWLNFTFYFLIYFWCLNLNFSVRLIFAICCFAYYFHLDLYFQDFFQSSFNFLNLCLPYNCCFSNLSRYFRYFRNYLMRWHCSNQIVTQLFWCLHSF